MPQVNNVDMAPDVTSVTLTAGKAVAKNSRINVGAANFTAGTRFTVTVTLRDASENPVTGAEDLLTNETVKVPGATRKGRSGPVTATEHTVPNGKQNKPVTDTKPHFTWRDGVMRKCNRPPITFSPVNQQRRSHTSALTVQFSPPVTPFLSP